MTKNELIARVANDTGETKKAVGAIIDSLASAITDTLKSGGEPVLPGLGKFHATTRAARIGRNPKNGDQVTIHASVAPKFKAAKALKDALN